MPSLLKEACVETLNEALLAERAGAHRLELCSDLLLDGLTPSADLLAAVLAQVSIPVRAMIRPRGGDFCYNQKELQQMLEGIHSYKQMKVSGFVTGVLRKDGKVDGPAMKLLATQAAPLPLTFHKAIDATPDILEAMTTLASIEGVQSILSSGGQATAMAGAKMLRQMIHRSADLRLTIIVAGKVTDQNLTEVHRLIGAQEYHGRRIVCIPEKELPCASD